jgi:hypothetical protein
MKLPNIFAKLELISILGAFLTGLIIGTSVHTTNPPISTHVPQGTWASMYIWNGMVLQLNVDKDQMKMTDTLTVWIKEDRTDNFKSVSGLIGSSIISKVSLDCSKKEITVLEQRAFDGFMVWKATKIIQEPVATHGTDPMTRISLMVMCHIEPEAAPDTQEQKQEEHPGTTRV